MLVAKSIFNHPTFKKKGEITFKYLTVFYNEMLMRIYLVDLRSFFKGGQSAIFFGLTHKTCHI